MSNSIAVTGNLTREPEVRYTREGHASTLLGVAVNRRWENRETREWEESTSFFDVVCWREVAENAALSLTKGMRVMVIGRLEQRSWETEDGERRSKVEIVADEIGPSLRFATADVQRNERRGPDATPEAGGAGGSSANGAGGRRDGAVGAAGDDGDETGGDDGSAGDGGTADDGTADDGTGDDGTGTADGATGGRSGGDGTAGDGVRAGAAAGRRTRRANQPASVGA